MFVQIVDEGSISAAAARLNIAKSAVSRRLALLEDRYESVLIERGPGKWSVSSNNNHIDQNYYSYFFSDSPEY